MPHLIIQHSENLSEYIDVQELCTAMHETMLASGVFPLGGIRVRAFAAGAVAIADQHPENAFADLVLRIGAGRSHEDKERVGDALMETAQGVCKRLLDKPYFALSLEIVEINKELSWKVNTIHPRVRT